MKTIKFISSLFILAAAIQSCQPKTDQAAIDKAQAEGKKSGYDSAVQILMNQADQEAKRGHEPGHVVDSYPPSKTSQKSNSCPVMYGLVVSDWPDHKTDTLIFVNILSEKDQSGSMHLNSPIDSIKFKRRNSVKLKWLNGREYPLAIPIWPQ